MTLRIALLSSSARLGSTRRLKEACEARGHRVRILDPLQFMISIEQGRPTVLYKGKPLEPPDGLLARIGASKSYFGTSVVRQFEQMGVPCLNSSQAILASRDKLRALQQLARHDVGVPATVFVRDPSQLRAALERVGGAPVIIKLLEGTQGIGVMLADRLVVAETILETLQATRRDVLIQRFVGESRGRDVRALVVGGRVVAAVRRTAQGDEFRSNVHRGARAERIELPPEFERTAVTAAGVLGLRVAGVDMLESDAGPLVMEVNSSPSIAGMEGVVAQDLAGPVVEHLEGLVGLLEVDLRERLGFSHGYVVAELRAEPGSPLIGRTLAELDLARSEARVLSLIRGGATLPGPPPEQVVAPGDLLVCFGRLELLRAALPPPRRRRRGEGEASEERPPLAGPAAPSA